MTKKIQNIFMGFTPKGVSGWDAFQSVCKLIGMEPVCKIIGMEPGEDIDFILSQKVNDDIWVKVVYTLQDGRIYYCPLIYAGAFPIPVDAAGVCYEIGMQYLKSRYNDGQIIAIESLVSSMIQKSEHICRKACRLL